MGYFYYYGVPEGYHPFWVVNPAENPTGHPDYYYGAAENHASKNYSLPEEKDIQGLVNLLNQVKLPEYEEDEFDCSESASFVEWLLEGAGFHAKIASDSSLGAGITLYPHVWVMVELEDGTNVAIETTSLTEGGDYAPPGIIRDPAGRFKQYCREYKMFQDWKEKYPPDRYDYDPNMSLEEWESEYLIELVQPGSLTREEYYNPVETYESPNTLIEGRYEGGTKYYIPESEFDWWNTWPYYSIEPFSEWD